MPSKSSFEFNPPKKGGSNESWDQRAHDIASTLLVQRDRERAKSILLDAQKENLRLQREVRSRRTKLDAEYTKLSDNVDSMDDFMKWGKNRPSKIERAVSPMFHRLLRAWKAKRFIHMSDEPEESLIDFLHGFDVPQIFLIEHDWGAALKGAKDFDEGEWPLPFSECAFEFQFLSRRVIVLLREDGTGVYCFEGKSRWFIGDVGPFGRPPSDDDEFSPIYNTTTQTIRALCIALDADVVETSVVRSPSNGHHVPSTDIVGDSYHVVSLAHRTRAASLPLSDDEPKRHVRLHFRRGHWRHFDNHKTWIKWMLVGNPDLGFIDKEYRA